MVFEVQGKTDNFVKLSKDTDPGIEFLSARKLVEYEIQMEALEFKSVNNISLGIVKFVFRRNMEFHVTNTFLQTFLLVCVGYFSYFFDVDNFSDRIMVVLTTMLVLATVTTSIQSVSTYYNYNYLITIIIIIMMIDDHNYNYDFCKYNPRVALCSKDLSAGLIQVISTYIYKNMQKYRFKIIYRVYQKHLTTK